MTNNGIDAPDSVEAGSTTPVEVSVDSGSGKLLIGVVGRDVLIEVDVDEDGKAQFEVPAEAADGDVIIVLDANDLTKSAEIAVVPAGGGSSGSSP